VQKSKKVYINRRLQSRCSRFNDPTIFVSGMEDASDSKELVRREESKEAASSSGRRQRSPSKDTSIKWSLVNRSAAVHQILRNFRRSYSLVEQNSNVIRPAVSYAPQMYGSGKTTVGRHFRTFVLLNRAYLAQRISEFPGIDDTGVNAGERAVEALLNETLYVTVDLRDFPDFDGEAFKPTLIKTISKEALSMLPNKPKLLAKVLKNRKNPKEWIESLFQVTKKRYLFLFIDEIGLLPSRKFYEFPDLDPERNPGKPNVYCLFFEILSSFIDVPYFICYVAGRSDAVIARQEDAISSGVNLDFVRLDPFPEDTIKLFLQSMTTSTGEAVLQILFPHHPEGHDWLFKQVRDYTGGVPRYIVHVMQVLVNRCIHNKVYNMTESEMYANIESTPPYMGDFATPRNMKPNTLRVFCALLLAAALKYEFRVSETICKELVASENSQYVLDIANKFGFYYEYCSKEGLEQVQISEQRIKLIFPKMFLKVVKEHYRYYPLIRYIYHLFPLHAPVESLSSLRLSI